MAGTVGAIFNGALQLGSAVGIAAVSSIETSVEKTHGGPEKYTGRAASFWFLLAIVCVELVAMLVFYKVREEDTEQLSPKTPSSQVVKVLEKSESQLKQSIEVV